MLVSAEAIRSYAFVMAALFALTSGGPGARAADGESLLAENRAALAAYFARQVEALTVESAVTVTSAEDWPAQKAAYRRQLQYSLGLEPMPARGPLEARITGVLEHDEFIVEKLHFQTLPGLYVTANLYLPRNLAEPAPTILYLCGHARRVEDGVSLGNKTAYQRHPAWFARHGYACLIVDTIQLGEIEGLHHGTHREGMWWWTSRGYTPAGVEAFNAMRALDYLETRKEVDAGRIGVTGRSGGGTGTLYLAALDDRVAAAAPVAGITDIRNHVVDFLTPKHCDCNYFPNPWRIDYARIVSLIAPRPLLIVNTDRDALFPLDGVQRVHARVRDVYDRLGATEKLGLAVAPGGHADSQLMQVPVFDWFNLHLKGKSVPIDSPAKSLVEDTALRVFEKLPEDEIVTRIHEKFVPAAAVAIPGSIETWTEQRAAFLAGLGEHCFRNWPATLEPLDIERVFAAERDGVYLRAWRLTAEPHVHLWLHVARAAGLTEPERINLIVADDQTWANALAAYRTVFDDVQPAYPAVNPDEEAFARERDLLETSKAVWAILTPRGVGPGAWAEPGSADAVHLRRCFPIIGQTLDGQRVLDVLRTLEGLRQATPDLPVTLIGRKEMAGIALYAAALHGRVEALRLIQPPLSHREGVELINVLRFMDLPQALALAIENSTVTLEETDPEAWNYAQAVSRLLDREAYLRFE
ncbi:MAG: prolyl oligopeptidase family serine peptidase [Phycisphaerales bacterium]|nr:prolyl oligopeptidase family serine peptidase [Phycisphaerales bacterium]